MLADRERILSSKEKQEEGLITDLEVTLFELDKVIEERCDEFDYYLQESGFTILKNDLIPVAAHIFNYEVFAAKETGK